MKKFTIISALFFSVAMLSNGQQWYWEEANLSMPKVQMGVASLGSKVYFAGGNSTSGVSVVIETYDIETGLTTTDDNLSAARILPVGVTCGSRVFFAGGAIFPTIFFKEVDMYNSVPDVWTYDNLSENRFGLSAVSHGSKVLFAGGINVALNQSYSVVDVYDTLTESWTTTDLSIPRGTMGAAVVGDLAIFAGGYDNQSVFDRVDIYHFSTSTWETATLSEARGFVSATAVGNKVLIAGGFKDGFVPSDRVDIYDASTNTWDTAHLSVPRCSENVFVTVGRYAFYVGGGTFNAPYYDDCSDVVDVYDSYTNTWSVIHLPVPLVWHSVTTAGNWLVVAGGQSFNGINWSDQDKIYLLDVIYGINDNTITDYGLRITNYPNPVSDITTFSCTLKESGQVVIQVFNSFGQLVGEPLNAKQPKGEQKVTWNAENLPAGIYFYRIQAGKEVGRGKMIKW